jgi:hypothetical protein
MALLLAVCSLVAAVVQTDRTELGITEGGEVTSLVHVETQTLTFKECVTKVLEAPPRPQKASEDERLFAGCPDAGRVVGALVKGLKDASFLEEGHYFFDESGTVLKVSLYYPKLYGEIASKSKVPVMWVLDQNLQFTMKQVSPTITTVDVVGMGLAPPRQGLELYEEAMLYEAGNDHRCSAAEVEEITAREQDPNRNLELHPCILKEIKAVEAFVPQHWDKVREEGIKGKLDVIMGNTYGDWKVIRPALKGAGEIGKVFYSLFTAMPSQFKTFTFSTEAPTGVKVTVDQPPEWEGNAKHQLRPKVDSVSPKSLADAVTKKIPCFPNFWKSCTSISLAETFSRSGMAFAEMAAWGQFGDVLTREWTKDPHMAEVGALMNMFSFCAKGATPAAPATVDAACEGSSTVGRVSWAPKPGALMQRTQPES